MWQLLFAWRDLEKDSAVLEAAYNDQLGVTAAFNKNILRYLNQTLSAGFDEQRFCHEARYNAEPSRIEMHLISEADQMVRVGGQQIVLRKGESIHTKTPASTARRLCEAWPAVPDLKPASGGPMRKITLLWCCCRACKCPGPVNTH